MNSTFYDFGSAEPVSSKKSVSWKKRTFCRNTLLVFFLSFLLPASLKAADYYWVGGTGNWSNINHWATTSGGSTFHSIVPSQFDDVYFDAGSGLGAGDIVSFPTSGHAYCRNMSWAGVTAAAQFRNSGGNFRLFIYGSLEMSADVQYGTQDLIFTGNTNATLTTNGAQRVAATGWYNPFEVDKPGATLTVLDPIVEALQVSQITLTAGHLDLSGNTHVFWNLNSNGSGVRSLDISNATITLSDNWNYRGSNMTLNAVGSYIQAAQVQTTDLVYDRIDVTIGSTNTLFNNTTINRLTFSDSMALPGTVRIGQQNLIQRLEFKGGGLIRANGNVIDSLIMAGGKAVQFFDTTTITGYFSINTQACEGTGELFSTTSTPAVIQFDAGVTFNWNNVYITNMTAAGTVSLPIDVPGADGGTNANWNFLAPTTGTTLYWVGGAGDWNDASHWSASSGGAGGYCIPFIADNVIFDSGSGFAPGDIVTTSANSWCNDMSWTAVANNPVFNQNAAFDLEVWGSIVLDNSVTMNAELILKGSDSSTFESNGSTLGQLSLVIEKDAALGGLTLVDDLLNTNTLIRLSSGKFLLPGRTIHIDAFVSSAGERTIDITNATITTETRWWLTGIGRTWVGSGAGSFITSHRDFGASGLTYSRIVLTSDVGDFNIAGATIGLLQFSNPSSTSTADIAHDNLIDSLQFDGAGRITAGGNTINTLLFAPSRIYHLTGTTTINDHFEFVSAACNGLGEMRGSGAATLQFGSAATVNLQNVYLLNMTATGNGTPIALSGADAGGNSGFTITSAAGGDRYWIGGSGAWNDNAHWSLTSGGVGGACIPMVNDQVFFDAASFASATDTVAVSDGNAYCHNMDWTGASSGVTFNVSSSFDMEVWGDLQMNSGIVMNSRLLFRGAESNAITVNGSSSGDFDFSVSKEGGSLRLNDNLINPQTRIELLSGALDLSGDSLVIEGLSDLGGSAVHSLDISDATIAGAWNFSGANKTLTASGSSLTISQTATIDGGIYEDVFVGITSSGNIDINNAEMERLVFTQPAANSGARVHAGNTLHYLEFKGAGAIAGTNNVMDTLVFSPGKVYTLANGSTTTINDAWYGSGTPCNLTEITSPAGATVNMVSGQVSFDYVRIQNITAAGILPFEALEHSLDLSGNANWDIAAYNGTAPILGLGADTSIMASDFPYQLTTEGFFGSPLAQYTWNDNSNDDQLAISDSGTYWVEVGFVDGCMVSDTIHIGIAVATPVELADFSADVAEHCKVRLSWKVVSAKAFASFVVERSRDARNFEELKEINFAGLEVAYAWTDDKAGEGANYYRLKLRDIDGRHQYSKVVAVSVNCEDVSVKIYPNPISEAEEQVAVESATDLREISVLSTGGAMLSRYTVSGKYAKISLNRLDLPAGVYILRVETIDGKMHDLKIIKH